MIEEISAGGVVIFGNAILLLRKFNGDWVLPKGKIEPGEDIRDTALREVFEESGVKAKIIRYLGMANYNYRNLKQNETVCKTVHWYLMEAYNMDSIPQKEEGFIESTFVHGDKSMNLLKYDDERKIVKKALTSI